MNMNTLELPLSEVEEFLISNSDKVEQWFTDNSTDSLAIYNSIDIRNSGNKIVPVDMNLFPAGFNNIHLDIDYCSEQVKQFCIKKGHYKKNIVSS